MCTLQRVKSAAAHLPPCVRPSCASCCVFSRKKHTTAARRAASAPQLRVGCHPAGPRAWSQLRAGMHCVVGAAGHAKEKGGEGGCRGAAS